jgi:hypothetical protein
MEKRPIILKASTRKSLLRILATTDILSAIDGFADLLRIGVGLATCEKQQK